LHFLTKLILAAPCSGLPVAPTALLSQDCAAAAPTAKQVINAIMITLFINSSSIFDGWGFRPIPDDFTKGLKTAIVI
jgi:hypothetical protein